MFNLLRLKTECIESKIKLKKGIIQQSNLLNFSM